MNRTSVHTIQNRIGNSGSASSGELLARGGSELARYISRKIQLQEEADELKSLELIAKCEKEEEKLKFQEESLKFQQEKVKSEQQELKLKKENSKLQDEIRRLAKHLNDVRSNSKNISP